MKKQKFNNVINIFNNILSSWQVFSEGQQAAITRIISLLKEKEEMFNEIFDNPEEKDFDYFFSDFFLHIEEDISDLKNRANNIFLLDFLKTEINILIKFKEIMNNYGKIL